MSLLVLLNPKQYGGVIEAPDTSDILDRYAKRRKKNEETLLEEEIAAQLLQKRQQDVVIPEQVNKVRLAGILQAKLYDVPTSGEVAGEARKKKIKMLLLALLLDD